ncbi:putative bifunctional diguanylate cyclase/phosphodiesterase [Allorhizobium undicola]|uniref:putative bifunctional diguanylate cyclase/phosphodiesterase n=1 Tax=Allorhizobium undicola TaxID=78527 RepID=UPI003D32A648
MSPSVEKRFLAIVGGTVFSCIIPLFVLLLAFSTERAASRRENAIAMVVEANAQALAKPLWDFDSESVYQIAATLVSSSNVDGVEVKDVTDGIDIQIPLKADRSNMLQVSRPIFYLHEEGPKDVGRITVYYQKKGMLDGLRNTEMIFMGIFLLAVIIILLAAIIGNRLIVMKPLLRLTAAIEATRRLGSRHAVDWESNDEMGRLAQSFNAMQMKLQAEENELKNAHRLATDIYNLTPAMLFSLDRKDRITSVSDYWLLATGYRRQDVIGLAFSTFLPQEERCTFLKARTTDDSATRRRECTTKFACADGRIMDVLIVESSRLPQEGSATLSLSVMTDITALKQSEALNRQQAITDHLTGLINRQGFEQALEAEIAATNREGGTLACLFVDLDRFKWINDNLGHQAGDMALRRLVGMILPQLPEGSVAARIGGDEFAILLRSDDAETAAELAAARICGIFETPFVIKGAATRLSASIGIALYPHHAQTAAELLQKADMAMYNRKRDGKNGLRIFDDTIGSSARRRAEIEEMTEQALKRDWFDAYLQPITDLSSGRTVGYEALMRLRHPVKGIVAPMDIITVAEETGAIHEIGKQVFGKALEHFTELSKLTGDTASYLALNLSPLQIDASLPVWLASAVHLFNIDPARIIIEITEATLMRDNPQIQMILRRIGQFGCRIALDDFGTGYSSLSYLTRFPVNIIKIDQSFIRAITAESEELRLRSRLLIEGIAAISHKMKCAVVAEGIETDIQRQELRAIGVDYGQGYLFGKPMAFEELSAQMKNNDSMKLRA